MNLSGWEMFAEILLDCHVKSTEIEKGQEECVSIIESGTELIFSVG